MTNWANFYLYRKLIRKQRRWYLGRNRIPSRFQSPLILFSNSLSDFSRLSTDLLVLQPRTASCISMMYSCSISKFNSPTTSTSLEKFKLRKKYTRDCDKSSRSSPDLTDQYRSTRASSRKEKGKKKRRSRDQIKIETNEQLIKIEPD